MRSRAERERESEKERERRMITPISWSSGFSITIFLPAQKLHTILFNVTYRLYVSQRTSFENAESDRKHKNYKYFSVFKQFYKLEQIFVTLNYDLRRFIKKIRSCLPSSVKL
jgi:hypothetical protein